ncbi:LysR family transcriptional regulator [Amycolatopsis benzoatilytica]|uniref:LysR family transcriptional regulator n=1 Tax=Amycolatopsis benzoatilytica TaxID=346045 RepID=UPI00036AD497|nr:LysR family transcriptional regulator [Amycolatopsis benzoatilytica]
MDLAQLRTAIALLHHRTVNRTAAAEGLAPSSVSDRVRRLEDELGAALFTRDRAGMHPTAAGRAYLASAASALAALDQAAERLHDAPGLVVGAQAAISDGVLPAVLAEHPALNVHLRPDSDRARLLASLDRDEIDAAVLLDTGNRIGGLGFAGPGSALSHLDVREIRMVTVAAPGSPLLGRAVTRDEVRRTGGLVGQEARCSFWMATERWLGPDVALTAVGGLAQVREWVAAGRGIAVLPEFAARGDLATGRLREVDTATPPLQLRLIWRPEREPALRPLLYALSNA